MEKQPLKQELSLDILLILKSFLSPKDLTNFLITCSKFYTYRPQIGLDLYPNNHNINFFLKELFNPKKFKLEGINISVDITMTELSIPGEVLKRVHRLKLDKSLSQPREVINPTLVMNLSSLNIAANLTTLVIQPSIEIATLSFLSVCTNLSILEIYNCQSLISLEGLNSSKLTILYFNKCYLLEDISALKNCTKLKRIELHEARLLDDVTVINSCPLISRFALSGSLVVEEISLDSCCNIRSFSIVECPNLARLILARSLCYVSVVGCPLLEEIIKAIKSKNPGMNVIYQIEDLNLSIEEKIVTLKG
jgi:hypothetical protein